MEQYHLTTHQGLDVYFPINPDDKDKYLVCTCAKNENDYIVEWVNHYLALGFDKIVICDNNDDESLIPILQDYVDAGTVEIYNCRGFDSFQVQFYSMFCSVGNYKWCGYFDCDEFLEIPAYHSVKDFLATINEDCVSFNWLMFGPNGQYHKAEGSVQERFPLPVMPVVTFKENVYIKSIVRGGDHYRGCWFNGSHIPMMTPMPVHNIGGYTLNESDSHCYSPVRYKRGYLKHYYTKSFDEWIRKSSRGWPDGTPALQASNYFICDTTADVPTSDYFVSLFGSPDFETFKEYYREILEGYNVIQVTNSNEHIATFICSVMRLMACTTGHTFIFNNDHIDDALFANFMEHAYKTGNRAVFCFNPSEIWNTYLKYNNGLGDTYYMLDFM